LDDHLCRNFSPFRPDGSAAAPLRRSSNGYRVRLWRLQLQRLADDVGLTVQVCHFLPGTSKWNKIEHRMFCHITGAAGRC
jgi:hypothetical protein